MERKIGEIFTYGNKTYQVVKVGIGIGCKGCAFKTSGCSTYKSFLGHCSYIFRRDNTGVIFKLINNNMEIDNNNIIGICLIIGLIMSFISVIISCMRIVYH